MIAVVQFAAAAAPHLGADGGGAVSFVRVAAALLVCLTIAALAILLVRQRRGGFDLAGALRGIAPRRGAIEVVETRRVSPHADVCLLRCAGREYLLVLHAGGARVLRAADLPPCA